MRHANLHGCQRDLAQGGAMQHIHMLALHTSTSTMILMSKEAELLAHTNPRPPGDTRQIAPLCCWHLETCFTQLKQRAFVLFSLHLQTRLWHRTCTTSQQKLPGRSHCHADCSLAQLATFLSSTPRLAADAPSDDSDQQYPRSAQVARDLARCAETHTAATSEPSPPAARAQVGNKYEVRC